MDAKICGVKDPKTLDYIINHNYPPKFIGFIANYPKSKRYLEFNQLKEILNGPAGNSPAMARFLHRIGQEVTEEMAKNTQNNTIAASVLDAKQEIEQIMADHNFQNLQQSHHDD